MEQHSVEINFGHAQVLWIRPDGAFHRKAYSQDQKAEFLSEVIGAESYIGALGWGG